jgi:hypothetical protein
MEEHWVREALAVEESTGQALRLKPMLKLSTLQR